MSFPNWINDNLRLINCLAKKDLEAFFEESRSVKRKVLVMDPSVDRLFFLTRLIDKRDLTHHHIQNIVPLDRVASLKDQSNIDYVFFLRPKLSLCAVLRKFIENTLKGAHSGELSICICFVPFPTLPALEVLRKSKERLLNFSRVLSVDIDFVRVDTAVLSMEDFACYGELFLSKDMTCIKMIARALLKLQKVYLRRFHSITAHGEYSCKVLRSMEAMSSAFLNDMEEAEVLHEEDVIFQSLIIVDRTLDPVAPLFSQKSYEGLLDAVFEINVGRLDLPDDIKDAKGVPYGMVSLWNDDDPVYEDLRYLSFGDAGKFLNTLACGIQDEYNDRHDIQNVSELRSFVQSLPYTQEKHKRSVMHTGIFEALAKEIRRRGMYRHFDMENLIVHDKIDADECWGYINECMHRKIPLLQALSIIILIYNCSSSWDTSLWERIKETLVAAYGAIEVIPYIESIEANGMFERDSKQLSWRQLNLKLIRDAQSTDHVSEEKMHDDVATQSMITRAFEDHIKQEILGIVSTRLFDSLTDHHCQVIGDNDEKAQPELHVFSLCIVGGMSLAEVEVIRTFEREFNDKNTQKIKVLIMSNCLLNPKKYVQSILGEEVK